MSRGGGRRLGRLGLPVTIIIGSKPLGDASPGDARRAEAGLCGIFGTNAVEDRRDDTSLA